MMDSYFSILTFQKALNLLAKIHLLTNDWGNAIGAAELVLEVDKTNTKAINVKAEALFNVCQFERALVLFYRGMVSTYNLVCIHVC